jgi:hypothetical protein
VEVKVEVHVDVEVALPGGFRQALGVFPNPWPSKPTSPAPCEFQT